ncbi:efflux RND transporter periplasmic adaptor subunit [Desulfonatronospira sp.]|uniref:efflux RND transporter periplasmic adaptor subunit n=1 Tax=Desulfonatronospira sp. TaxID=1962951 RepID=UPI0025C0417A|nr:efflux RND transporter periplasmic adaptor subunit [Desulfonatronospira sp.]
MKLVADDVRIAADESSPGHFTAEKPGSKKALRITAAEAFLMEGMRRPYSEIVLLSRCNSRFSENIKPGDLKRLIQDLDEAGMISDENPHDSHQAETLPGTSGTSRTDTHDPDDRTTFRNHWSLFNPQTLLDYTLKAFGFLRHFHVMVLLFFAVSIVGFVNNLGPFLADISEIRSNVTILHRILFALLTINFITQFFRGLTARHFGFETPSFGMTLVFGLLPRFNLRTIIPEDSTRKARLWFFGSPIYVRFITFPLGIFMWLAARDLGTSLSVIGISLSMVTVISCLFVVNPLFGGAGYRFMGEYFEVPNLRKKAFARLKAVFSKRPSVVMQYMDPSPAVLVYGISSVLFTLVLAGLIGAMVASRLEANLHGLGVAIFLLVLIYLFFRFWYQGLVNILRRKKAQSLADSPRSRQADSPSPKNWRNKIRVRPRHVIIAALIGACFIPYQYESGGKAEVFPVASAQIYSEYPRILEQVYFDGGEFLEAGTVVAVLSNERQEHDVAKTLKEIEKQKQLLNVLLTTPSQEQLKLAEEQLNKSQLQLRYRLQHMEAFEKLYRDNTITFFEYQKELEQLELAHQSVKTAKANLDHITTQVNKHEIESARIEIAILQEQLAYYQEVLERTRLKMPIDGMLVTMNLKNLQNSFIDDGELFAEVEDTSSVRVEIQIPEGDMDQVSTGDSVRLRLQAYSDRLFNCSIEKIHPTVIQEESRRLAIMECIINNNQGELKSGMTGFAKVEGDKMPAISAFTRTLVRLIRIEAWSWLP